MNPIFALALTLSSALLQPAAVPADRVPEPRPALLTQAAAVIYAQAAWPASASSAMRARLNQPGGDSLKNGAIVGAVIAGTTSAVVLGYFCHLFNEGQPCFWPVAWRSAVAAAGGAAAGAGIDALFARAPSVSMRVRF